MPIINTHPSYERSARMEPSSGTSGPGSGRGLSSESKLFIIVGILVCLGVILWTVKKVMKSCPKKVGFLRCSNLLEVNPSREMNLLQVKRAAKDANDTTGSEVEQPEDSDVETPAQVPVSRAQAIENFPSVKVELDQFSRYFEPSVARSS
ncbi:hypothetical protein NLI96_g10551 [Meripilus lineatus]|uniref:Uncharacterized protein n=1 Tax=Meripilus lineatus TaxID=2056292 RepID=A0AAD5UTP8_9APHY|nr:hypothetical protein NLI96_g10551 [Physisporinus lineatus]